VFAYLPIEIIIKSKQKDYYRALSLSDKAGNSTLFIEFMLGVINEALQELLRAERQTLSAVDRIELYRQSNPGDSFTRRDYLAKYKEISTATASRDLKGAVEKKLLVKKGAKRTTVYRFAKRR
jgi:Fic family protein